MGKRRVKICKQCGKEFLASSNRQMFCSYECRIESYPTVICPVCGNEFKPHRDAQTYCSKACCDKKAAERKREFRANRKRSKGNAQAIAEIERIARENGMSYGEWTAREYIRKSV